MQRVDSRPTRSSGLRLGGQNLRISFISRSRLSVQVKSSGTAEIEHLQQNKDGRLRMAGLPKDITVPVVVPEWEEVSLSTAARKKFEFRRHHTHSPVGFSRLVHQTLNTNDGCQHHHEENQGGTNIDRAIGIIPNLLFHVAQKCACGCTEKRRIRSYPASLSLDSRCTKPPPSPPCHR